MKSAARQLAYHLLDLPYHVQVQIAEKFGVDWKNRDTVNDTIEKSIIQAAVKDERLAELWEDVEKRHPNGDRVNNPFKDERRTETDEA